MKRPVVLAALVVAVLMLGRSVERRAETSRLQREILAHQQLIAGLERDASPTPHRRASAPGHHRDVPEALESRDIATAEVVDVLATHLDHEGTTGAQAADSTDGREEAVEWFAVPESPRVPPRLAAALLLGCEAIVKLAVGSGDGAWCGEGDSYGGWEVIHIGKSRVLLVTILSSREHVWTIPRAVP